MELKGSLEVQETRAAREVLAHQGPMVILVNLVYRVL